MSRLRLGVALLVPQPIDREVDALRRACCDGSLGRVPPHVTLVPPVNVREERLGEALGMLRAAGAASRPLRLTLGPPVTFLPANPVLYLAIWGDLGPLEELRGRVFTGPLERSLSWPFVPHVTLVDDGEPDRVRAGVRALAGYRAEVVVERLTLLHEQRDDAGRRVWRPLADAALAAPAVIGRGGLELELAVSERLDPEVATWMDTTWAAHTRSQ
ncbi:2'-5' RNA ligase family protein [soil metagenome]